MLIFLGGNPKQQHRANARCMSRSGLRDKLIQIKLENAGHTRNSDTPGDLIGDEQRQNEVVHSHRCLAHKGTELRRSAESAETVCDVHVRRY